MKILYCEKSLHRYLSEVIHVEPDYPVLIERFLEDAREYDVDALCDGSKTYIAGILEHIEHAGVHSGDSWCVWPAQRLTNQLHQEIISATSLLAKALQVKGLLNVQFATKGDKLYVLEVNPRASRTVPFICKATGTPMIQVATRLMLGATLADCADELPPQPSDHVAVKAPIFPFEKFRGTDPQLGPEMKSTGEVMGIDRSFSAAIAKATLSVLKGIPLSGNVFISVKDTDKAEAIEVASKFVQLGFQLIATTGTAQYLKQYGLETRTIRKQYEGSPNAGELIESGEIHLVINTPIGEDALHDDSYIRKTAIEHRIPMITTMAGAHAMAEAVASMRSQQLEPHALQSYIAALSPLA